MNCEDNKIADQIDKQKLTLADRWILSKQQAVIDLTHKHLKNYRFDLAAQALYEFSWHEFCDWYLELCKPILFKDDIDESIKQNSRRVLLEVLENLLKLLHPIIPFLTEEAWQPIAKQLKLAGDSISIQEFPRSNNHYVDIESLQEIEWSKEFINGIRKIRSERDIVPKKSFKVFLINGSTQDRKYYTNSMPYIKSLANIHEVEWLDTEDTIAEAAMALVGEMKIMVPLAGLIDKDVEIEKLEKEIKNITSNLEKSLAKLDNPNFADKAPAAVVNKERDRVAEMQTSLQQLKEQLDKVNNM
jgi:valyl-tRNA synthetase